MSLVHSVNTGNDPRKVLGSVGHSGNIAPPSVTVGTLCLRPRPPRPTLTHIPGDSGTERRTFSTGPSMFVDAGAGRRRPAGLVRRPRSTVSVPRSRLRRPPVVPSGGADQKVDTSEQIVLFCILQVGGRTQKGRGSGCRHPPGSDG